MAHRRSKAARPDVRGPARRSMQRHLATWLVKVADRRVHGITSEQTGVRFERRGGDDCQAEA